MPEVTYFYPNDATDSSSEESTRSEHPRRRVGFGPVVSASQQPADQFTTSSSESSLEDHQQSEEEQHYNEFYEENLAVVTEAVINWIARQETSGSDADSERSATPEAQECANTTPELANTAGGKLIGKIN